MSKINIKILKNRFKNKSNIYSYEEPIEYRINLPVNLKDLNKEIKQIRMKNKMEIF